MSFSHGPKVMTIGAKTQPNRSRSIVVGNRLLDQYSVTGFSGRFVSNY